MGGTLLTYLLNELDVGPEKGPLPCAASGLSVLPLLGSTVIEGTALNREMLFGEVHSPLASSHQGPLEE